MTYGLYKNDIKNQSEVPTKGVFMNRIATFVKGIGKLCGAYLSFNFLNAKMKKLRRGSCLP